LPTTAPRIYDNYQRSNYAIIQQLFNGCEVRKFITLIRHILHSRPLQLDSWHNTQGDRKRQFRDIAVFEHETLGAEIIQKIIDASDGIIHDKLKLAKVLLIRSLLRSKEQNRHIDAGSKESRGCSVIVAIMKGTYLIHYSTKMTKKLKLDVGDVIYFSNAFEHGGGAYTLDFMEDDPFQRTQSSIQSHYRFFLSYVHVDDHDDITFKLT